MARTVKQIPAPGRVQIKEYTRHDNYLLLETCLEEVETVGDGAGEALKIEPEVLWVLAE
jgi:hypothetical protein